MSRSAANCISASLPCCLSKGPPKQDYLDNYLTTFFRVRNFRNTSAMRVIFFWKCSKFNPDFKNAKKNPENLFFYFWDNIIWICCIKMSLLRREYFSSAMNVLTASLQILHMTKRDFFQLNCLHSYQQISQRHCR